MNIGARTTMTQVTEDTSNEGFPITFQGFTYDVKNFIQKHPGGPKMLKAYKGKDISKTISEDGYHDHAISAKYILQHCPPVKEINENMNGKIVENLEYEHLVNWDKPMVLQVGNLGPNYNLWVNAPVDRRMRLFGPDWMERCTNTPWWIIPTVYLPIICTFLYFAYDYMVLQNKSDLSNFVLSFLWCFPLGIFQWTLLEYTLHRFVFHMAPPKSSRILITLHFLMHGIHHKTPFDDQRLVFPPILSLCLCYFFYIIHVVIYPPGNCYLMAVGFVTEHYYLVVVGFVSGYVCYDLLHYYVHHGTPARNSYLERLKHNHSQHHYVTHDKGYGVSVPLWDVPFQTRTAPSKRRNGKK